MGPVRLRSEDLPPIQLRHILSKVVVKLRDRKLLDLVVTLGLMHGHVEDAKVKLAKVGERIVDMLRLDQAGDELVWHVLRRPFGPLCGVIPGSFVLGR